MPEARVYKDGDSPRLDGDVGVAGKVADMDTVSQSSPPQDAAYYPFQVGI